MLLPLLFQSAITKGFDPLAVAIARYEVAVAAYNATPDWLTDVSELADIAADETHTPALEVLREWDKPAATTEVAATALKLAIKELLNGDTETAEAMMRAALGFLEQKTLANA